MRPSARRRAWFVAATATSIAIAACASFSTDEPPSDSPRGDAATTDVEAGGDGDDTTVIVDPGDPPDATVVRDAALIPDGGKIVFVTGQTFVGGQISGRAGASERCQALALDAGLPGTYVAYLREGTTAPNALLAAGKWYRLDGELVFDAPPTAHNALATIVVNGQGAYVADAARAWTGDDTSTLNDVTCNGWADPSGFGVIGATDDVAKWSNLSARQCTGAARLYCFQR